MKILSAKYYKDATGTGKVVGISVTTPETSATHMVSVPIAEGIQIIKKYLNGQK